MRKSTFADEIILSYNDAVLRRSDLQILSRPRFLNERIIKFYFSYLSSSSYVPQDVLLLPPSIAFWISNCPDSDSLCDFVHPLNFPETNLVLFPINGNDDVEVVEGGSHWSLLAYHRPRNLFIHRDSLGGMNNRQARRLYSVVGKLMGAAAAAEYMDYVDSPLQRNGYDCGLFVIAIAGVICTWYDEYHKCSELNGEASSVDKLWFSTVKEQLTSASVWKWRGQIVNLITSLMEDQK